jgi:hypothetical protein
MTLIARDGADDHNRAGIDAAGNRAQMQRRRAAEL